MLSGPKGISGKEMVRLISGPNARNHSPWPLENYELHQRLASVCNDRTHGAQKVTGPAFVAYVEPVLSSTLSPGDILDNLPAHSVSGVRCAIEAAGLNPQWRPIPSIMQFVGSRRSGARVGFKLRPPSIRFFI